MTHDDRKRGISSLTIVKRPLLLDLFCGAGGAGVGYHRAGYDVVGVDVDPQPDYPFDFWQGDVFDFLALNGWTGYDAIHASPPCQAFTQMNNANRGKGGLADERPDLLTPTLAYLADVKIPWVVENVSGAQSLMPNPIRLHGGMFGLGVRRIRLFSSNRDLWQPWAPHVSDPVGVYGRMGHDLYERVGGGTQRTAATLKEAQDAMGMDWGDWNGVKEAVPPAYTEFIGKQLLGKISKPDPREIVMNLHI